VAEIPIQRKEGHAVWPWVLLGLIILAAVLWFVYAGGAQTVASARADSAAVANGAVTTDSVGGAMAPAAVTTDSAALTPGAARIDSAQQKVGP
jgi:type IV secretory pathway TrbL component